MFLIRPSREDDTNRPIDLFTRVVGYRIMEESTLVIQALEESIRRSRDERRRLSIGYVDMMAYLRGYSSHSDYTNVNLVF